jgi:FtsH-binding integral membrane protein
MTLAKHGENSFSPSKNFQLAEHTLIISYLSSFLLLVALIFYTREFDTPPQVDQITSLLYITNIGLSIAYLLTIIIGITQILWKQRKNPYSAIMQRLNYGLHGDLPFLSQLQKFDTATLQYALIQYRQSWGISENRVSLLTGNLRKLGLFPALAAASISASTLMKDDSSFLLWLPVVLAAVFSIIGFIALGQRERPQQVIELLEYAIETSKEVDSAEPAGDEIKENNYHQRAATGA